MKKILILSLGAFLLFSCSDDNNSNEESIALSLKKKTEYLKSSFPKVLELSETEIDDFKRSMTFNEVGVLSSWNNNILRLAYTNEDEYNEIIIDIIHRLDGDITKPIIVVDDSNKEYVIVNKRILDISTNDNLMFGEINNSLNNTIEPIKPVEPGTYIFPDQKNRLVSDGCKRDRGSTCVIKVT